MTAEIMDVCEFTDITRAFCAHCKDIERGGSGVAQRRHRVSFGDMVSAPDPLRPPCMEATFDSTCPDCGCRIDTGDVIAKRNDEWLCAPCGYTYDLAEKTARQRHPSGSGGVT